MTVKIGATILVFFLACLVIEGAETTMATYTTIEYPENVTVDLGHNVTVTSVVSGLNSSFGPYVYGPNRNNDLGMVLLSSNGEDLYPDSVNVNTTMPDHSTMEVQLTVLNAQETNMGPYRIDIECCPGKLQAIGYKGARFYVEGKATNDSWISPPRSKAAAGSNIVMTKMILAMAFISICSALGLCKITT